MWRLKRCINGNEITYVGFIICIFVQWLEELRKSISAKHRIKDNIPCSPVRIYAHYAFVLEAYYREMQGRNGK